MRPSSWLLPCWGLLNVALCGCSSHSITSIPSGAEVFRTHDNASCPRDSGEPVMVYVGTTPYMSRGPWDPGAFCYQLRMDGYDPSHLFTMGSKLYGTQEVHVFLTPSTHDSSSFRPK